MSSQQRSILSFFGGGGGGGAKASPAAPARAKPPSTPASAPAAPKPKPATPAAAASVRPMLRRSCCGAAGARVVSMRLSWTCLCCVGLQLQVGCRVRVYWPNDDAWYVGAITALGDDGQHTVTYDDGDVETLSMSDQKVTGCAAVTSASSLWLFVTPRRCERVAAVRSAERASDAWSRRTGQSQRYRECG